MERPLRAHERATRHVGVPQDERVQEISAQTAVRSVGGRRGKCGTEPHTDESHSRRARLACQTDRLTNGMHPALDPTAVFIGPGRVPSAVVVETDGQKAGIGQCGAQRRKRPTRTIGFDAEWLAEHDGSRDASIRRDGGHGEQRTVRCPEPQGDLHRRLLPTHSGDQTVRRDAGRGRRGTAAVLVMPARSNNHASCNRLQPLRSARLVLSMTGDGGEARDGPGSHRPGRRPGADPHRKAQAKCTIAVAHAVPSAQDDPCLRPLFPRFHPETERGLRRRSRRNAAHGRDQVLRLRSARTRPITDSRSCAERPVKA